MKANKNNKYYLYNLLLENNISFEKDIYDYGVYIFKSYIFVFCIAFIISFIINTSFEMLLFTICFLNLRKYSGGFHFKNITICSVFSILFLLLTSYILKIIQTIPFALYMINFLFSVSLVYFFGPIENINKRLSDNEKKYYKMKTIIIEIIFFAISLCFKLSSLDIVYNCISGTIMICFFDQLIGLLSTLSIKS